MLDTHTRGHRAAGARLLPPFRETIEFRDVISRTTMDRRRHVLRDVSFAVRAGQMLAIVGRSGAGKTTLVNLIPRFYDVTSGRIIIDGVDIRDVTLRSLRGQIGIVTQETVLFDDTIAANIAYGRPGRSRGGSKRPHAPRTRTSSSSRCRDGYGRRIGERGQRLSGGQRQRHRDRARDAARTRRS